MSPATKRFLVILVMCGVIAWPPYFAGVTKMPWPLVSWLAGPIFSVILRAALLRAAKRADEAKFLRPTSSTNRHLN